jgi:signal peptidase I
MMPTFNPRGDIVLVDHVSVTAGLVQVGDVVIARSVQNPRHVVCKRVLGMEGDYVEVPPPIKAGSSRRVKVKNVEN